VDKGMVKDISDLYSLKLDEVANLERMATKSAQNLLDGIEASKQRELPRLIYALGIPGVGERTGEILAFQFKSLDNLMKSSEQDIVQIHEIGPIMAKALVSYFKNPAIRKVLEKLKKAGLALDKLPKIAKTSAFTNKSVVITGTLEKYSRHDAERLVKALGGRTQGSIGKNTDFLVVGENPGSKLDKAKKLGVKIISENEFRKLAGE